MQKARSIRSLSSLVLLSSLASVAPAFAGPIGADAQLKAKFDSAEAAYDVGEFDRARRLYTEAYELKPLPGFLFNIGQCHRKLGEWNKAAFFYRRYLARVSGEVETSKLEALIAEMDAKAEAPPPTPPPAVTPAPLVRAPSRAAAPPPPPSAPVQPKLTPTVSVEQPSRPVEAVSVSEPAGDEPLYKQWWVWAGAGAVTVATVAAVVAVGVVNSSPQGGPPKPPKFGKLDAR